MNKKSVSDATKEGLGPETPLCSNAKGGIQSDIPYRCDLLPAKALNILQSRMSFLDGNAQYKSIELMEIYLDRCLFNLLHVQQSDNPWGYLVTAAGCALMAYEASLSNKVYNVCFIAPNLKVNPENEFKTKDLPATAILECAKIAKKGAASHGPEENWRLITANDHINHAQVHLWAYLSGDRQDNHLGHAAIRFLFALETKLTPMGRHNPAIKDQLS